VFVVEKCLASLPHLTCKKEFMVTVTYSTVPNISTKFRLVTHKGHGSENLLVGIWCYLRDGHVEVCVKLLRFLRRLLSRGHNWSGLPYGSVQKAKKVLKLHPYPMHAVYELKVPASELQL
jgi:hypothetical protein